MVEPVGLDRSSVESKDGLNAQLEASGGRRGVRVEGYLIPKITVPVAMPGWQVSSAGSCWPAVRSALPASWAWLQKSTHKGLRMYRIDLEYVFQACMQLVTTLLTLST